jgi:uncharacterized protein YbbK (DUF523 family)
MKEKLIVSACLMGRPTRYDARAVEYPKVRALFERYEIIEVCPEVMGGLETPRPPSERRGAGVFMKTGRDVSCEFLRGAERVYELCCSSGVKRVLLKERSPSCGSGEIYDGSFSGVLIKGDGVTAEYLKGKGILVFGESQIDELLEK